MKLNIRVVTDNDGDVKALKKKYEDYLDGKVENIKIFYDDDQTCKSLEPQLLKANSLVLNKVLVTAYTSKEDLLIYMSENKTDSALKVFDYREKLNFPEYINNAIQ